MLVEMSMSSIDNEVTQQKKIKSPVENLVLPSNLKILLEVPKIIIKYIFFSQSHVMKVSETAMYRSEIQCTNNLRVNFQLKGKLRNLINP